MKTAVIYYSYLGNTHRVAQWIIGFLKGKGEEAIPVRIRPLKEETNFFRQCTDAFFRKKPELYRTLLNLSGYDRIILGSPVWAFKPAPAINTYLSTCSSLDGKEAVYFVTYSTKIGKEGALECMEKELEEKGAQVTGRLSFHLNESIEKCRGYMKKVL